jgi:uncharacterized protein (TIGR02246 family)
MEVVDALCQQVAELERTQRAEDVQGFLALFDRDAMWVTGGGRRLIGREAIGQFTAGVLPGAFADGSTVTYAVTHVLFISDAVAVTGVSQQYFGGDGVATSAGLPTYVWRRGDDGWKIVVGQNTAVVSD